MPGIIGPGPGGVDRAADAGRVIAEGGDGRWTGVAHEEIWAMVQQGDPVAASETASFAWMKTQVLIQSVEERLSAVSGTAADWEGAAATAARGSVSALGQWAIDGAAGARNIAQTLIDQSHEALFVRQHMPEPRTQALSAERDKLLTDPGYAVASALDGFAELRALEAQAENDAQRARELMAQYETRSRGEIIPRLQEMPPPPQVTVEVGAASTPPAGPGVTASPSGVPAPVGPAAVAAVGPAGVPGVPPPPVGEVPVPPAAVPPGATPAGPPGTPPPATPPVPPLPTPGTGGAGAPAATPPATQAPPFPTPGTSATPLPTPLPTAPRTREAPPPLPTPPGVPPRPGAPTTPLVPRPGGAGSGGTSLPRPTPATGWRDVVQSNAGGAGAGPVPQAPVRSVPFGERPPAGVPEPAGRPAGPRLGATPAPGMYPPLAPGMGAGGEEREHRRAPFLIDDTGAFADDRWFPPAVITPET